MAQQLVYDLIEPSLLINYVRAYDNEVLYNNFTLERYLPNTLTEDLEYRIRSGTWQDVDTALYRAWDTPAPFTKRQGMSRFRGELAPVSRQIALSEEEFLRLRALQSNGRQADLVNAIYSDAERMVRSVQARIELARGQLLVTGTFALNENGLNVTADFGMPGTHKPTAATLWTNPAADILGDLLTWTQLYVDDTGTVPGVMLMSRTVLGYMYLNTAMRQAAAFAGTTPSRINNETIDAIFAANGLPPIEIYDTKVRVNGTNTSVIGTNKVLLLPSPGAEPMGNTFYGVTAEALKFQSKGYITQEEMPGIVACIHETESPIQTFTLATAVAVPALPNPKLVVAATVA